MSNPDSASYMIDDAVAIIQKVSTLQQAVHSIESEEQSEGIGRKELMINYNPFPLNQIM